MNDNKPLHTISYGAIRVAIWRNDTPKGIFYDVSFSRRYREGELWASSNVFGARNLPILAKAILDAHSWIHSQAAPPTEADEETEALNDGNEPDCATG